MSLNPGKLDELKNEFFLSSDLELAQLSGLAPETISRIRHGRTPKLETLEQICSGFNKRLKALKKQHILPKNKKNVKVSDLIA